MTQVPYDQVGPAEGVGSPPTESHWPLSAGQEGLWFLYRLAPGSAAYNVAIAVQAHTPVEILRLSRAVAAVEDRHDLLRSRFMEVSGRPWRMVDPPLGRNGSEALEVHEVGEVDDDQLRSLARDRCAAPFPLAEGGRAFRAVLLRRASDDAVLMLVAHHIVADASSLALLLRDLLAAYQAEAGEGASPGPAPLASCYDDFVNMERRLLASPRHKRLEAHWREVCAGSTAAHLVPDHALAHQPSDEGGSCELRIPEGIASRLRTASAAAGVTPFAYLLGAFQSMLHRHTGQSDFLVGTSVAVRLVPGLRDVVGYLVNLLPLRARFDRETTLADAVTAAKQQVQQGLANVGYPFQLMGGEADPDGGAGRPPLFRVTFTMLFPDRLEASLPVPGEDPDMSGGVREYAGLKLSHFEVPQQEGQFDLSVELRQARNSLTGVFRYRTDLFGRSTIEALADRFVRFTEIAVAEPGTRVADVPLVDRSELDRLLAFGRR